MRYRHILDVESGLRHMAHRYHHERASGVWRAFAKGGPSVSTTAATTSTTTTTQMAPRMSATTAGPSTSSAPGPLTAAPAPPPPSMAPPTGQPATTGTQTTPAAVIDTGDFRATQRDMQRMLRRLDRLQQEVLQINKRMHAIKKTLQRANL
ncbi:hypothetical protein NDU88_003640 [Pleurodeles waltl]|uniref:Uncharacterized protein n=1 Tax=Pleurodeles waltl TaxID=8319 RepID=A0AAV7UD15_PLEWA|nr:hypothetical protein NDU88_003640 [Pleurodeles waltl]